MPKIGRCPTRNRIHPPLLCRRPSRIRSLTRILDLVLSRKDSIKRANLRARWRHVVEVSVMSKDEGPEELLVEAIGEFRLELIEWIDFQLNLLCEREAWPMAGSAGAIAPANVLAARPEPQAATAPGDCGGVEDRTPAARTRRGCRIACATRFQAPARRCGPPPWG